MSKDLTINQMMEIEDELNKYVAIVDCDVSDVFRRYRNNYYSAKYVKNRVSRLVYNAIRKEYKEEVDGKLSASHAQYTYPSTQSVLRDMYDYKKYMERNKNEDKNENIPTGIQ